MAACGPRSVPASTVPTSIDGIETAMWRDPRELRKTLTSSLTKETWNRIPFQCGDAIAALCI